MLFGLGCFCFYRHHLSSPPELSLLHLLQGPLLIFAMHSYYFQQGETERQSMHERLSDCWVVYYWLPFTETKSSFTGTHPAHGNSVNWPIPNTTLDSHLTSPCSVWFMWVCWLNRVFFLSFCLIASLNLLFSNTLSSGLVWLTGVVSVVTWEMNHRFASECVPWMKLWMDVYVIKKYQKHSCVLETVQHITQEGI